MSDKPLLALTRAAEGLPRRSPKEAAAENMRQLIQLRWIAVAGQLAAILVASFGLGVTLPLLPMLAIVALLAVANILFLATLNRGWVVESEILLALLLDVAALTAQFYLSGGARNPFISLYLLQVVLGAILLPAASVWVLVAATSLCFAFLTVAHLPLSLPATIGIADLRLLAEWMSFVLVAVLLVLFINRISRNLRARDAYVSELGQRAAEEDSIVRMGLFASGAAHELGTPLSSLSVLIADWQRSPAMANDPQMREELADAAAELERCKDIVSNILHSAGMVRGEAMGSVAVDQLLGRLGADWIAVHDGVPPLTLRPTGDAGARVTAEPALPQAIWSLLENAAEAGANTIDLQASIDRERVILSVTDDGPGFPDAQLANFGRLYQSSKGEGHGLGLFLASNVARRLGGTLEAFNRDGRGAIVRLLLPLASVSSKRDQSERPDGEKAGHRRG